MIDCLNVESRIKLKTNISRLVCNVHDFFGGDKGGLISFRGLLANRPLERVATWTGTGFGCMLSSDGVFKSSEESVLLNSGVSLLHFTDGLTLALEYVHKLFDPAAVLMPPGGLQTMKLSSLSCHSLGA